jgi:Glyoxalase/Bleomycin resistance protein/Dioxygenase superfamily
MSPTIDEIIVGDPPEAWMAAGFTVDPDGVCRIGRVRVRLVGRDRGERVLGWSLREVTTGSLGDGLVDGLATTISEHPPAEPGDHPNGSRSIDHVVLATPDCDRTIAALEHVGFEARRTRHTDSYGSPMRQTFFRAGEVVVELVGPDEANGDGPAAFFGLAVTVADLDATVAHLGDAISRPKEAVQSGRWIATLRHRDLGLSVATAFMSPDPA